MSSGSGGFSYLHVQDCIVRGPEWTSLDDIKPGESAIRLLSATGITIVRSDPGASMSVASEVTNVYPRDGVPAIDAPGADIVVLSSTVTGGSVNGRIIDVIPPLPAPG